MNLIAVSPFRTTPAKLVLDFLSECDATLVLLPGALENTPTPPQVQRVIRPGVHVFVEARGRKGRAIPNLVSRKSIRSMPQQIFWHKPSASEIDSLAAALPRRTFRIGGRRVSFFICGELVAFNPDASVKHGRSFEFDIIANPAHTTMGHWNHLGRKLSALSKHGAALYATNNDYEHPHVSTDVRIYRKGKMVRSRNLGSGLAWSECSL